MQRGRPAPGRLLFVAQSADQSLAQHLQTNLCQRALEAVLCGQTVIQTPIWRLYGADEQTVVGGHHAIGQPHLHTEKHNVTPVFWVALSSAGFRTLKSPTHLFPAIIISLNKPFNWCLGRFRLTLQERGVVFNSILGHLHCVPVGWSKTSSVGQLSHTLSCTVQ